MFNRELRVRFNLMICASKARMDSMLTSRSILASESLVGHLKHHKMPPLTLAAVPVLSFGGEGHLSQD